MFDAIKQKVGLAQSTENNDAEQQDVTFSTEETETVEATDEEVSEVVEDTLDTQYDFDSVEGRIEVAQDVVNEDGDVVDFDLLTEVAEHLDMMGHNGVKSENQFADRGYMTTRQGSLVAGGLRRSRQGPQEAARELASLRAELEDGAPDSLPSTGEKGMWKQARRVQVDVIKWVLDV